MPQYLSIEYPYYKIALSALGFPISETLPATTALEVTPGPGLIVMIDPMKTL
jgi:hypothetical protein